MNLNGELYTKFHCGMFVFYIAIFVLGMVLYYLDFGTYGAVAFNETQEWNKGIITDVIVQDTSECPVDYTQLKSLYLGTETYCLQIYGTYTIGTCSSGSKKKYGTRGRTVYGFSDTNLQKLGDKYVCYRRSLDETFLTYIENRLGEGVNDTQSCPTGYL